jgi:hypothetical protein
MKTLRFKTASNTCASSIQERTSAIRAKTSSWSRRRERSRAANAAAACQNEEKTREKREKERVMEES